MAARKCGGRGKGWRTARTRAVAHVTALVTATGAAPAQAQVGAKPVMHDL